MSKAQKMYKAFRRVGASPQIAREWLALIMIDDFAPHLRKPHLARGLADVLAL